MKYTKPEIEVIELDITDVITTSGEQDNSTLNPGVPWPNSENTDEASMFE